VGNFHQLEWDQEDITAERVLREGYLSCACSTLGSVLHVPIAKLYYEPMFKMMLPQDIRT
jgi:hypothetical protein